MKRKILVSPSAKISFGFSDISASYLSLRISSYFVSVSFFILLKFFLFCFKNFLIFRHEKVMNLKI